MMQGSATLGSPMVDGWSQTAVKASLLGDPQGNKISLKWAEGASKQHPKVLCKSAEGPQAPRPQPKIDTRAFKILSRNSGPFP